jgi:choline dehydrogenase-like flavoprotein
MRSPKVWDVCIVGSGAAGGTAAKVLTEGGLNVVMLEAGPMLNPGIHYTEHLWPYNLPHRGVGIGGRGTNSQGSHEFDVANISQDIEGEPYSNAPGSAFRWTRARLLGGRTNHWNCVALRFSDLDLRTRTLRGYGEDWPVRYEELAPYYEKVETFIGVYGSREGIEGAPDGVYLPPPAPRCSDLLVKRGCEKLRIPCIAGRAAIVTKAHNGRAACHYCAQCTQGCRSASSFSSSQVMIPPALKTGRLTIVPNAMARKILVDAAGKASGVSYVDKTTRTEQRVRARAVWLGAGACESARLLLNSGIANSSGTVGRYLMETTATMVTGTFPELAKVPAHNHDGTGSVHVYMPFWKYGRKNGYEGGYHVEVYGGRTMPKARMFAGLARAEQGYGEDLKRKCRAAYGTTVQLHGRGEMIPNRQSYCEIDPESIDRWGIPTLRFNLVWSENEIRMAADMRASFLEIVDAAGGQATAQTPHPKFGYVQPGGVAHEVGVARMGRDKKNSVLNGFCQAHDVKNLFVSDGACFTTSPDKNPTISILALTWRAAEYALEQARRGEL